MSLSNHCKGCLSSDRKLVPIGEHEKLYQQLLLAESKCRTEVQLLFCWECIKIIKNIQKFRLKITQAQELLSSKHLLQYDTLSNLVQVTKLNDYKSIIYEDVKQIPIEVQVEIIKNEKLEYPEESNEKIITDIVGTADTKEVNDILKEATVKNENDDIDDNDDVFFDDYETIEDIDLKKESDEVIVSVDLPEPSLSVKQERKRKNWKIKYRTIILEDITDKMKLYDKVKIDYKGLQGWIEKKKQQTSMKNFQCDRCFCGFSQQKFYDYHLAVRHAKSLGRYECDICSFRFADKNKLAYHVRSHFVQFVCKLCKEAFGTRSTIYLHFTHGPHGRLKECKECGLRFDCRRRKEFYNHYRTMHEQFICDFCGKKYLQKRSLVQHISNRHIKHCCKECNLTFSSQDSYIRHNRRKHVVDVTEHNYCVECNMQFINSTQYNDHLRTSVRHRANRAIPCPECGKIYTKRSNMTNHFGLVHLKKTKYYCAICDTYYLNGYRLRYHQKFFHEKREKPKNKLCKYCGRGFSNNRILENHVRTHTGERPFACAQCSAAFAQKQSLATHVKSAHK